LESTIWAIIVGCCIPIPTPKPKRTWNPIHIDLWTSLPHVEIRPAPMLPRIADNIMNGDGYPIRCTSPPAKIDPLTRDSKNGRVANPEPRGENDLIAWKKNGMQ
jgi:hypothetical protein